uniref:Reverse transcriptase Ty1/copia-type domain-containing protein n=1 Tax=Fagus sylvatica TaxID=28930 RepID=A0A2N9FM87_FAGSY
MLGTLFQTKCKSLFVLNSLPPSWDHVVTSLTHSGKELAMTTLPVLLMLKEERMKRKKRDNASSSLMMAQSSHATQFKPNEKGHYKINCLLNKSPKNKGKEIAMTITEAMVIESPLTSWCADSATTRHIARNRELFVDFKEKQLGEHREYMGNNTYSDVLGEDKGLIESRDAVFIEDTKLITPLEQIKKLLHAESEESDPHVLVFSDKDLENSGRKRTSLEPVMPSIDADDSGRKRQRRPSSMLKDYYLMESKVIAIEDDPANFAKAMESRKPVVCKWVLRKKYKADGSLDKYKASLDGFQIKGQEGKVCRLKKSLYGLKQSSRQWYLKFHQAILDIGYEMSHLDHCVYVWRDKEKLALLSLYVDDILLASNSPDMMKVTKFCLRSKFEIKDMGPANYVLGIRISRDRDSKLIYLDQENYLEKVLKKFKMEDYKPVSTPVSKRTILNKSMCPTNKTELKEMIAIPYAQAVGSLMYTMTSTRPDICYAVGLVSRYQSNPGKAHWQAVKRIFRYLQMTKSMKLCFGLDELEIK